MTPELWQKVQALLDEILDLPQADQEQRLQALAEGQPELVQEARAIILAEAEAEQVLDNIDLPLTRINHAVSGTMTMAASAKQFDQYSNLIKVGAGGMGVVYRARDLRLDRQVALKFLSPNLSEDKQGRQRFLAEAKAISKIDHPNVCLVLDFGESQEGQLYFTMPFYKGSTLKEHIQDDPLGVAKAIDVIIQVSRGVQAAHKHNVIHRDIKPANVLITNEGIVKLLDFGIAKAQDSDITQSGQTIGTIAYMSPEQLQGEDVDFRTDIWSIGVLFYELLATNRPFRGKNNIAVSNLILKGEYMPLRESFFEVPDIVDTIMEKTLAVDPLARYQSIEALLADLEKLQTEISDKTRRTPDALAHYQADEKDKKTQSERMTTRSSTPGTTSHSLMLITDEFAKWAGPSARIVVNTISQNTDTLEDLCYRLAEELPSESDRQQFLEHVNHITRNTGITGFSRSSTSLSLNTETSSAWTKHAGINRFIFSIVCLAAVISLTSIFFPKLRYMLEGSYESTVMDVDAARGVYGDAIYLGMTGAFSGGARALGHSMKVGIEAKLKEINEQGGIHGRQIFLKALDDQFESKYAAQNVEKLFNPDDGVFALIGNVGLPTTQAVLTESLKQKTLLFGALSGAKALRETPPAQYVFNFRASYTEEIDALVEYLVDQENISAKKIAVFYQDDDYGLEGLSNVQHALTHHDVQYIPLSAAYQRNTVKIDTALDYFADKLEEIDAFIIVATYKASALFTEGMLKQGYEGVFANVSFVGGQALAEEFKELGTEYGEGVIISHVVPFFDSYASGVLQYREALAKYFPNEKAGFVSLEGYIVASIFCLALDKHGRHLHDTNSFIDTLHTIHDLDLGIGPVISYTPSHHQGSHHVWGSRLNAKGEFEPFELIPSEKLDQH